MIQTALVALGVTLLVGAFVFVPALWRAASASNSDFEREAAGYKYAAEQINAGRPAAELEIEVDSSLDRDAFNRGIAAALRDLA